MQPVKILKFLRQLGVLVQRNLQLIWNDKLLLASLALQSPFMVLVVKLTADPNCFTSNLVNIGSRTALFILAAMATFMGTLNSYREICKEREIILREASVGVSLPAVVLSKAVILFLIEILQAVILAMGFVAIVHVPQNHLLLETDIEIFVTLLLTMFSSSCVGLLISALFSNGESAILAVLVLMIGQVVFSNVMFTLTGAAATISTVIVCRWGMGALGASTDLNSRMAWLQAGLDGPMYDATVENLTHSWQMLGLISLVSLVAAWLVLLFVSVVVEYGTERALAFRDVCAILVAGVAIPMAFQCLMALRLLEHGGGLVMIPLVAAFCSDSAALFAGMALGKHKLAPRVSPKKTVEGSVGGLLGGMLGMIIFRIIFFLVTEVQLNIAWCLLLGLVGAVMGQLGDLSFSAIKRECGVKDYGRLLPGHGGVLDRFDSVIFASPVVWLIIKSITLY